LITDKDINNYPIALNATEYIDSYNIENEQDYYYGIFPCKVDINGKPNFYNIDKENTICSIAYMMLPGKVSEFEVIPSIKYITIKWKDPIDIDLKETVLVRKLDSEPTSPYDGIIIIEQKKYVEYQITQEDTLYSIAMKFYNDGTKWEKIYQDNQSIIGKNPNSITPGQILKIFDSLITIQQENIIIDNSVSSNRKYYYKCFPRNINNNYQLNCECKEGQLLEEDYNDLYFKLTDLIKITNLNISYEKIDNNTANIILNWINPDEIICTYHKLTNIMIRYSYDHPPLHVEDGEEVGIIDIINNQFEHLITSELDTFNIYYTLFIRDESGVYILGVNGQIAINLKAPGLVQESSISILRIDNKIGLNWTDPEDEDWKGTKIVKKIGLEPTSADDGIVILDSIIKNQYQTDYYFDITSKIEDETIYYKIYSYAIKDQYNTGTTVEIPIISMSNTASNLNVTLDSNNNIAITFNDPTDVNWHTKIVRKKGEYPSSITDGDLIIDTITTAKNEYSINPYLEKINIDDITLGIDYYYKAFTYNNNNIIDHIINNTQIQSSINNIDFANYNDYSNFISWENWYIDVNNGDKLFVEATEDTAELVLKDIIILSGCTGEIILTLEVSNGSRLSVYNNDVLIKTITNGGQYSIGLFSGINSIKINYKKLTQHGYCSISDLAIKYIK
jgi:hypothetical protein